MSAAIGLVCMSFFKWLTSPSKKTPQVRNTATNSSQTAQPIWAVRRRFIEQYQFPQALTIQLRDKHPNLTPDEAQQVIEGLRQYFLVVLKVKAWQGNPVAMPSLLVDSVWRDFIGYANVYTKFCERAFGTYLHHIPYSPDQPNSREQLQRTYSALKTPNYGWALLGAIPLLFILDRVFASHVNVNHIHHYHHYRHGSGYGTSTSDHGFEPMIDESILDDLEAKHNDQDPSAMGWDDDWANSFDDDVSQILNDGDLANLSDEDLNSVTDEDLNNLTSDDFAADVAEEGGDDVGDEGAEDADGSDDSEAEYDDASSDEAGDEESSDDSGDDSEDYDSGEDDSSDDDSGDEDFDEDADDSSDYDDSDSDESDSSDSSDSDSSSSDE